jgi:hypothetical protein
LRSHGLENAVLGDDQEVLLGGEVVAAVGSDGLEDAVLGDVQAAASPERGIGFWELD